MGGGAFIRSVRSAGGALTSHERECGVEGVERRGRASGSGCNRALSGESHRLLRGDHGVCIASLMREPPCGCIHKEKVMTGRVGVAEMLLTLSAAAGGGPDSISAARFGAQRQRVGSLNWRSMCAGGAPDVPAVEVASVRWRDAGRDG